MSIAVFGSNQAIRVTQTYLNDVNDPAPGVPLTSPSGTIVQYYTGQVGAKLSLDTSNALKLSDSAIGTLYDGVYQYVLMYASSSGAAVRGQIAFWQTRSSYTVTADVVLGTQGLIAGVFINVISKGSYGFIQIAGKASVLFKNGTTKATPADGDLVIVNQGAGTPTAVGDVLADATSLTSPIAKSIVGVAHGAAPTNAGVSPVDLASFQNGYVF